MACSLELNLGTIPLTSWIWLTFNKLYFAVTFCRPKFISNSRDSWNNFVLFLAKVWSHTWGRFIQACPTNFDWGCWDFSNSSEFSTWSKISPTSGSSRGSDRPGLTRRKRMKLVWKLMPEFYCGRSTLY